MARGSSHEANHCAGRYGDVRDRGLCRHRIGDSQCGLTELISRGGVHRPTTTHSSVLRWHSAAARTAWLRAYPGAVRPKGCRRSSGERCWEFTRPAICAAVRPIRTARCHGYAPIARRSRIAPQSHKPIAIALSPPNRTMADIPSAFLAYKSI